MFLSPWGRIGLVARRRRGRRRSSCCRGGRAAARTPWRRAVDGRPARRAPRSRALVVFLEPAVELRQVAREPNRIAVLIDDSRSMSLARARRAARPGSRASAPLIDASGDDARGVAREPPDRLLHVLRRGQRDHARRRSRADRAEGKATLIRKALEYVRGRYEGRDLAGIVLITDGAATGSFDETPARAPVRDFLRSLDTRVHTVWAARPGLQDVAVARVIADEFAFVRTVVKIEAVIRTTGYRRAPGHGHAVDRRPAAAPEAGRPAGRRRTRSPSRSRSRRRGSAATSTRSRSRSARDEAVATNNTRSVRDPRRSATRSACSRSPAQPSWDVRALRQMLEDRTRTST